MLNKNLPLSDKLVLITGASQGIGAETAKASASEGAHVILIARTHSLLDAVAANITSKGGKATVFAVDLANATESNEVMLRILNELGTPDVVIHNAGSGSWYYTEDTSNEQLEQFMAIPFMAAFRITHDLLPTMLKRNSGQIIFIHSPASLMPWGGASAYVSARYALRGFNKALSIDLRHTNICVTSVMPGLVDSNYFSNNPHTFERLPTITRLYPHLTTQHVAKAIIAAIKRRRRTVILPFLLKLTVFLHKVMPDLVEWLVKVTSHKRIIK